MRRAGATPLALSTVRLKAARIPHLQLLMTFEDVISGKPHPQRYELAPRKFGVNVKECLVFDEAAAGILASRATGARVIVVSETHIHPIEPACTTIPAYERLVAHVDKSFIRVGA
jgi:sugar-phosphatase